MERNMKRPAVLALLLVMLHAAALNGVVITGATSGSGGKGDACIVSYDVCGQSAPGCAVGLLDFTAVIYACADLFSCSRDSFPRMREESTESARLHNIFRPPKPALV